MFLWEFHSISKGPRMLKHSVIITILPSRCLCSCFCCSWRILMFLWQWNLSTGQSVIMTPGFIICNNFLEESVPFLSKANEILFTSVVARNLFCSSVKECGIQGVHIFRYFNFFVDNILGGAHMLRLIWLQMR